MSIKDYDKAMKALNNVVNSISCEICKEVKEGILPGLCPQHIFCTECAGKIRHCPSCHSALKLENIMVNFNLAAEVAPLLKSISECLIKKRKEDKKDENVVATTTKKKSEVQKESAKKSSTPSSSKISSATGRRTSLTSTSDVNKRNKKGETLLHVACIKGNIEEVKRLLAAGARCNTKDYAGWTPLHEVAQQGKVILAQLLLEHGAKVNATGGNLNSPLHEAASVGVACMVSLLMQFGACPDQHNLYGETSKDIARNDDISELLKHVPSEVSVAKSSSDDYECLVQSDQRQLIVMESGLDQKQHTDVTSLAKVLPIQLTTSPTPDVKIVITAAKNNLCERSIAVLTGLSTGAWIVTPEWLEMSAKSKLFVDPEPYEVYGTVNQKVGDAPKRSRLNLKNLMPGLFAGCHIYFATAINLEDGLDRNTLIQIVRLAGGQILSRSPDPEDIPKSECTVPFHVQQNSPLAKCSHYIIYQKGGREPQMKYNMKHIKTLPHSWLLACIENFSLIDP